MKKGTSIPYISHLLGVCGLVLEYGGDEESAIAALLHDTLEDHPETVTPEILREKFGERVLKIVEGCTDTPLNYHGGQKPFWRERKEAYLNHIRQADFLTCQVALADKLHNVRAILTDYKQIGDKLWSRFNAGKEDQLWYFRNLVSGFRQAGVQSQMLEEFARSVTELEQLAGPKTGPGDYDKNSIIEETKRVIKDNHLNDYLKEYPWMVGFLGNPQSRVWFVGVNPSLRAVRNVHNRSNDKTPNLQWNSSSGEMLLREALTETGFKSGNPGKNEGWNCYITNVIKEPEIVKNRNERKKDQNYWKPQAKRWLPLFQLEINNGNPSVLVAIGKTALKILEFMRLNGLKCPQFDLIPHYSYIMLRPDNKSHLGPRHPLRIKEFKDSICRINKLYGR
jgi:uracil-DNA glycosylase